jgi:hypothetical protein
MSDNPKTLQFVKIRRPTVEIRKKVKVKWFNSPGMRSGGAPNILHVFFDNLYWQNETDANTDLFLTKFEKLSSSYLILFKTKR